MEKYLRYLKIPKVFRRSRAYICALISREGVLSHKNVEKTSAAAVIILVRKDAFVTHLAKIGDLRLDVSMKLGMVPMVPYYLENIVTDHIKSFGAD